MPVLKLDAPPAATLVAITNATIITASHGTIENGTIIIRNGKIAAIGKDLAVPAGAQVIDGKGKYVMPGIIDAHSHSSAEAINEGTRLDHRDGADEDVLEDAIGLYRELAGGVTTLNILHGSANTDRRPERRREAALGLAGGIDAVCRARRRASSSRWARTCGRPTARRRPGRHAAVPAHPDGPGGGAARSLHPRAGVSGGVEGV